MSSYQGSGEFAKRHNLGPEDILAFDDLVILTNLYMISKNTFEHGFIPRQLTGFCNTTLGAADAFIKNKYLALSPQAQCAYDEYLTAFEKFCSQ